MIKSRVARVIMLEILRRGGRVESLFRLVNDLDLDYGHARLVLRALEQRQILSIQRRPGRPLIIEVIHE